MHARSHLTERREYGKRRAKNSETENARHTVAGRCLAIISFAFMLILAVRSGCRGVRAVLVAFEVFKGVLRHVSALMDELAALAYFTLILSPSPPAPATSYRWLTSCESECVAVLL